MELVIGVAIGVVLGGVRLAVLRRRRRKLMAEEVFIIPPFAGNGSQPRAGARRNVDLDAAACLGSRRGAGGR